jgi:glutamate racemase
VETAAKKERPWSFFANRALKTPAVTALPLHRVSPLRVAGARPCIGVFDSGVGGLSVLRSLRARLPATPMVYIGDVSHAPYGERAAQEVIARSDRIVAELVRMGAGIIVVACNTATVLGIATLRARWPALTVVGVEPGVKPAAVQSRRGRIAVMATPATAVSARLRHLIDTHAAHVHVHVEACPGLADAIESGMPDGPSLSALLAPRCDAVRAADVDTVVLGCTHYPFVAGAIQRLLGPGVGLVDTASAIAQRVVMLCGDGTRDEPAVALRVFSTGATRPMNELLARCAEFDRVDARPLTLDAADARSSPL